MAKSINLTGTAGEKYNLDDMRKDTRKADGELLVQVWKWNPNLPAENPHSKPNPPSLVVGQMWLTKLVAVDSEDYNELKGLIK